jgi:CRAL/TRIO domain
MSTISITAPQFTDTDVRLEQETYTEAEIHEAHQDLYGPGQQQRQRPRQQQSQDIPDRLVENFYQRIQECPPEEKESYLEAVERAPYLIGTDSNPLLFLNRAHEDYRTQNHHHQYDHQYDPAEDDPANPMSAPDDNDNVVWMAAERFVNYWELRRWLFGERAWLPMTATGNGALCPRDVELLRTGFCTLLPQQDRHGRGILCFQVPVEPLNSDRLAMSRVTFYVLSLVLWSRPWAVQNGIVVVVNTRHFTMERYDRKFIKCIAYLFKGWHPVTTRAIHITAPPGSKSCLTLILPFVRHFMTRKMRQRLRIHRGTVTQCTVDLKEYGIETYSLPVEMGGEFHKEQFREWLHDIVIPDELCREKEYMSSPEMDGCFYSSSDGSLSFPPPPPHNDDDDDDEVEVEEELEEQDATTTTGTSTPRVCNGKK